MRIIYLLLVLGQLYTQDAKKPDRTIGGFFANGGISYSNYFDVDRNSYSFNYEYEYHDDINFVIGIGLTENEKKKTNTHVFFRQSFLCE
jgi:hypothetical protein